MTRTDETVAAILRRYRECVAAGFPPDMGCVRAFATMARFAANPKDDRLLESTARAIAVVFRYLGQPKPSMKSVERILAAISAGESRP